MGIKIKWLKLTSVLFCMLFFLSISGCTKNASNKIGNSAGNIQNSGIIATQGNWLYFSNFEDNKYLYKIQKNGKSLTRIIDDAISYINVVGNWIYYTNISDDMKIYKIKLNGDEKTKLCDEPCTYLTVVEDKIFYINHSDKIYSMDINGTSKKVLNEEHATGLFLTDEWIYFSYNDYTKNAYTYIVNLGRMKFDGSEYTNISMDYPNISFSSKFIVIDQTVYFINSISNGGLYQMKIDGSDLNEIVKGYFGALNINDNYIYLSTHYANSDEYSYVSKFKLDNKEYNKIYNKRALNLLMIDDQIYFRGKDNKMYQMKQDGTELTLVP